MVPPIPSWKERLKACFRWRHRLMHVIGVPAAVGAITAVAAAASLNPDTGMALGALTAGVGSLLAGYFVTAGFDKKLVERLQQEWIDDERAEQDDELSEAIAKADPQLRKKVSQIVQVHASIEAEFQGEHDKVEAILATSRSDLFALRDRAIAIVGLHKRLGDIIEQSDGRGIYDEIQRTQARLNTTPPGPVRAALQSALESTQRTHAHWKAAIAKRQQIEAVLTIIGTNLKEFKLAMELRKADAAMSSQGDGVEVSELQARLAAAGQACDELVGRDTARQQRRTRSRAAR